MNIRRAFVSNSSTTSFCIYGCVIEDEEQQKASELGLEIEYGSDRYDEGGLVYAGRSFKTIKDNETGWDFKHGTQQLVEQINPDYKCETIEEAYRDG